MFKQGAFVNLLTANSQQWIDQFRRIEGFPSLDHVELWIEHIPSGSEVSLIRDLFRGIQLIVHGPFIHASLVSHLPAVVTMTEQRFDRTVEFASSISAKVVTFHAGSYPLFFSHQQALQMLALRFERFTETSAPIVTLENMPVKEYGTVREPVGKLSDCEAILQLLPKLRFTLDVGHCIQNEDEFVPFIRKHSKRIEDIHLHDGHPLGKAHLGLGRGSLDLDAFLDALVSTGFTKYVGIETISAEDTRSSWNVLCSAEERKGLRDNGQPSSKFTPGRFSTHI